MTRHSKSNKDGSFFTYHERHNIRHGSEQKRLPGSAMKEWHHCALSLTTPNCDQFVVTPAGVIYDREAIVTHLLKQKEDARKAVEQLQQEEKRKQREEQHRETQRKLKNNQRVEQAQFLTVTEGTAAGQKQSTSTSTSKMVSNGALNFWVPGAKSTAATTNTNASHNDLQSEGIKRIRNSNDNHTDIENDTGSTNKKKKRKKDDQMKTVCPVKRTPLRLKHLITIHPTSSKQSTSKEPHSEKKDDDDADDEKEDEDNSDDDGDDEQKKNSMSHDAESVRAPSFICPVCLSPLINASKPVALRTGIVLCARCIDAFVRKQQQDPINGQSIDIAKDVIVIDNSGTGFAGSAPDDPGSKVARIYKPSVT